MVSLKYWLMYFGVALTVLVGCNTQRPCMCMMEEISSNSTSGTISKRGIFSMEPSFVANQYLKEFTKLQEEGDCCKSISKFRVSFGEIIAAKRWLAVTAAFINAKTYPYAYKNFPTH